MPESISYEQYLNEHGELTYKNKGGSMRPLLRAGRDLFTVKKKGTERCRAGDVVLFRHAGNVVLHRVVELKEGGYVCLGDNAILPERGVTDADILGVMTGFIRKGKAHTVDEPLYRLYSGILQEKDIAYRAGNRWRYNKTLLTRLLQEEPEILNGVCAKAA